MGVDLNVVVCEKMFGSVTVSEKNEWVRLGDGQKTDLIWTVENMYGASLGNRRQGVLGDGFGWGVR